jgi:quercetin dioxygenase-like cupin family protein
MKEGTIMPVKPKLLDIKECKWDSPRANMRGGVCFQGGSNITMTIGEGRFPHETKTHDHDYEQGVFIYQGECEFYCDGIPYHLDAGCIMIVPPNADHGIAPLGNIPYMDMDIFYPKRTEDRFQDEPIINRGHLNWDRIGGE